MKYKPSQKFAGVSIASSEVVDGSIIMDTKESVACGKKFLEKIGAPDALCYMPQVHGNKIIVVDRTGEYTGVDGLLTQKNLTLAVKTADCIPVIIYDAKTGYIGAIHAGRKSICLGILSVSLGEILKMQSIDPSDLVVFLGPHIRCKNYGLRQETAKELEGTKWKQYLVRIGDKTHFDLTRGAKCELEEIGVKADNIEDCGIDTFEDERFFSVRKSPGDQSKRFLTVVYKHETGN